jgi:hypothetical protein
MTTRPRRERRQFSELDVDRSADLDNDGAPGYTVGVAVTPDGTEEFVLVRRECINDADVRYPGTHAAWRAVAPHELTGRIPQNWLRAHGVLICGRRSTATGKPCRNTVDWPGDACPWHDDSRQKMARP